MNRRSFLRYLMSLAGMLALPRRVHAKPAKINPHFSPFSLGIASGSPSADGFVIWTKLTGDEIPIPQPVVVAWEIFNLADPAKIFLRGNALAVSELDYAVHVEVTGLLPNHWYGYRFRVGKQTSPVGKGRTLPAFNATPERLRFSYASCQHWESGYYAAYRHMLNENLDYVVFVGDYIYEGASSTKPGLVRRHGLPTAHTLADYRRLYAVYKSDPLLQAMHAHCSWLLTWDDHEVQNDYAGTTSVYNTSDFLLRRAAAYQAYYEHMPLRASVLTEGIRGLLAGAELKLFGRYDFGKLAAFHVMDCRQYRDAPVCPQKPNEALAAVCMESEEARSLLGMEQEHWLAQSLGNAAEHDTLWNILVQSTRFTPENYPHGPGVAAGYDTWDGYPEARQRLLNTIERSRIHNPIVIGGDIHQNWIARVHKNPYDVTSPVLASEFVGTSISSSKRVSPAVAQKRQLMNPHCLFSNTDKRGYGVVELTHSVARVDLKVLDDVRNENSGISTLASFTVKSGKTVEFSQPPN